MNIFIDGVGKHFQSSYFLHPRFKCEPHDIKWSVWKLIAPVKGRERNIGVNQYCMSSLILKNFNSLTKTLNNTTYRYSKLTREANQQALNNQRSSSRGKNYPIYYFNITGENPKCLKVKVTNKVIGEPKSVCNPKIPLSLLLPLVRPRVRLFFLHCFDFKFKLLVQKF